jgi:hypothetical protein
VWRATSVNAAIPIVQPTQRTTVWRLTAAIVGPVARLPHSGIATFAERDRDRLTAPTWQLGDSTMTLRR